jgi:hypothetical protein
MSNVNEIFFRPGAGKSTGIFRSNGEHWQNIRRTCLQILRDAGMGRRDMEKAVIELCPLASPH